MRDQFINEIKLLILKPVAEHTDEDTLYDIAHQNECFAEVLHWINQDY